MIVMMAGGMHPKTKRPSSAKSLYKPNLPHTSYPKFMGHLGGRIHDRTSVLKIPILSDRGFGDDYKAKQISYRRPVNLRSHRLSSPSRS
jgi:hypothetical protein